MSEPFIAEIRIVGFNFPPRGWAFCDGQILPIAQFTALFSMVGTTYGGDGRSDFALPDLRGRTPIHHGTDPAGNSYQWGQRGGTETVTLTEAEMPSHTHAARASSQFPNSETADNSVWAPATANPHATGSANATLFNTVQSAGGNLAHENMQPYLTVNFCIALEGRFPSRS